MGETVQNRVIGRLARWGWKLIFTPIIFLFITSFLKWPNLSFIQTHRPIFQIVTGLSLLVFATILQLSTCLEKSKFADQYIKSLALFFSKEHIQLDPEKDYKLLRVEYHYLIGYISLFDKQIITYELQVENDKDIENLTAKAITLGYFEKEINLENIMKLYRELRPSVIDVDYRKQLPVLIYRKESERAQTLQNGAKRRAFLAALIDPPVKPGEKRTLRFFLYRPNLWDALRDKGKDFGSYTRSAVIPDEFKLKITTPKFPRCIRRTLRIIPLNVIIDNNKYFSAKDLGHTEGSTWILRKDDLKKGVVFSYDVECVGFTTRTYKIIRKLIGSAVYSIIYVQRTYHNIKAFFRAIKGLIHHLTVFKAIAR